MEGLKQERPIDKTIVDNMLHEVKKHGTDGFPIAVYEDDFAYFEQGMICWHWHEELQFSMVKEQNIAFDVAGKSMVLEPGDAIFINSEALHQIRPCRPLQGSIYSYIFRASFLEHDIMSEIFTQYIQPVLKNKELCITFRRKNPQDQKCLELLDEIRSCYFAKEYGYQLQVKSLLGELWRRMTRRLDPKQTELSRKEQRDIERVKAAIACIAERYREKITLQEIADDAYISKSELCRCFGRVLQTTPVEYLIQYRVQEAARMLAQTGDSITTIAQNTGFDSAGHLGRFFRKYMGTAPGTFRRREQPSACSGQVGR